MQPSSLPPQAMDPKTTADGPRVDRPGLPRALEERRLERPARLGEEDIVAEVRQQAEELLDVPPLVEEIRAEDEIPRSGVDERRRRPQAASAVSSSAPF